MEEIRLTTKDGGKNPVNNGINYQHQLVSRISEPSTGCVSPNLPMKFARSFLENACFWKLGPTLSPSRRVCGRVVVEDDDSSESGGNLINSPAPCRGIRGNHSTYPPTKTSHQLSKRARFNFTLHGFQSALEILE